MQSVLGLVCCLAFAACVPQTFAHAQSERAAPASPAFVLWDAESLERTRARLAAEDPVAVRARDAVLREAKKFLERGVRPVVTGKEKGKYTAPTGDPRDYVSLSPYWWPDPEKEDGLPYVHRDGEINPDRANYDANKLADCGYSVLNLSIAFWLTGEQHYAKAASAHLRAWFLDEKTRMQPHFEFAQFRPGRSAGMHGGMIEALRIRWLPDCAVLLLPSEHWSAAEHERLRGWFSELLDWMLESKHGKKERKSKNNHGTWYVAQAMKFAVFAGREKDAKKLVDPVFDRIDKQIAKDGSQPHEMRRTRSLGYHDFNLRALLDISRLARPLGIDVLGYQTKDGRGMRKAIDFALPRMTGEMEWTGKQIVPPRRHNQFQLFRLAARLYDEPRYERAARKLQPTDDTHAWMDIVLPAIHEVRD